MRNVVIALALMLFPFIAAAQNVMLTARQYYPDVAADVASNHGNDIRFVQVNAATDWGGTHLNLDAVAGKAELWMYTFFTPDDGMLVLALAGNDPLMGWFVGEFYAEEWNPEWNPGLDTLVLEEGWVDSDQAAAAWVQYGLQDYIDSHPGAETSGMVLFPSDLGDIWVARITSGTELYQCIIAAATMEMLDCGLISGADDVADACDFSIGQINPNPIRPGMSAEMDVTAHAPSAINISVYDIQGRLLGMVSDREMQPGTMRVVIPSGLLPRPGVYFVRAQTPEGFAVRKLVVTR
jgi:hypothetical protein